MSEKDGLQDRVEKFRCLELPGQPMSMHVGTASLVNDLWREVERLRRQEHHLNDLVEGYKNLAKSA